MIRVVGFLSLLVRHADSDFLAPKYTIDLDLPASRRWAPVCQAVIDRHGFERSVGPVVDYVTEAIAPLGTFQKFDLEIQAVGLALFGIEYLEELQGCLVGLRDGGADGRITTGIIVFMQVFYEFIMECTGVVAREPSGKVTHGRNMDVDPLLTNITAEVTWVKAGVSVVTSTQYIGYMGIHTGMRLKHGWSVQSNHREIMEPGPWGWEKTVLAHNALALLQKHRSIGYAVREVLLATASFDEAVEQLSSLPVDSPLYFIVAGPDADQGAVITRSRDGLARSPRNTSVTRLHGPQDWYRIQTNWDNWMPITQEQCRHTLEALPEEVTAACQRLTSLVFGDARGCAVLCNMTSDGRREAGAARMERLGSGRVSADSILQVLSEPPVLAKNTQFTSIMRPADDTYQTLVRERSAAGAGIGFAGHGPTSELIAAFQALVDAGSQLVSGGILAV